MVVKGDKMKYKIDEKGRYLKGTHPSPLTEFKKGDFLGNKHPMWNGGKYYNSAGYVLVYLPEHPGKDCRGYFREHRLVMEKHLGRYLDKKEVIHHINGIKDDNRIENLVLCRTNAEHMQSHTLKVWSRKHTKCIDCGCSSLKHEGLGLCIKCYRRIRHARENNNNNDSKYNGRDSWKNGRK